MFKLIVPAGTEPKTARTVTVPGVTPVAMPDVLETVATVASEDVHAAELVRFCVVPSAKVPTACSCTKVCSASLEPGFGELTAIDTSCEDVTTSVVVPLTLPCVAVIVADPDP
jgi:hypothetical protein